MEDDDTDETVEFKSKQPNIGGIEGMAIDVDDYSKGDADKLFSFIQKNILLMGSVCFYESFN